MARLIAQQQVERDNRDRMHQKVIGDLQNIPKWPQRLCRRQLQTTQRRFRMP